MHVRTLPTLEDRGFYCLSSSNPLGHSCSGRKRKRLLEPTRHKNLNKQKQKQQRQLVYLTASEPHHDGSAPKYNVPHQSLLPLQARAVCEYIQCGWACKGRNTDTSTAFTQLWLWPRTGCGFVPSQSLSIHLQPRKQMPGRMQETGCWCHATPLTQYQLWIQVNAMRAQLYHRPTPTADQDS